MVEESVGFLLDGVVCVPCSAARRLRGLVPGSVHGIEDRIVDPINWHPLVNTGALAAFAIFVIWGFWRIITVAGSRVYILGERYVDSTEKLHDTLKESDARQKELCASHATALVTLNESFDESLKSQAQSCAHLQRLVEIHERPGESVAESINTINRTHDEIIRMKRAARRGVEMCRAVAHSEFPNAAHEIDKHCDEIERLIADSGPIDVRDL